MAPAMTSPTSATSNRRGFTLLELLITIGIVLLLAGILIATLGKAMRSGKRAAIAGQIQAISVALEQYKQEYNDYPRVTVANTGAAVLCKALMAPGPAAEPIGTTPTYDPATSYEIGDRVSLSGAVYVCIKVNPASSDSPAAPNSVSPTDTTYGGQYWRAGFAAAPYDAGKDYVPGELVVYGSSPTWKIFVCTYPHKGEAPPTPTAGVDINAYWSEFNWADGGDEQTWRTRRGGSAKSPYLQAGTFKVNPSSCAILDRNDNPILYFPAAPGKRNPAVSYADTTNNALYDISDNLVPFSWKNPSSPAGDANARARLVAVLGDHAPPNGLINAPESAATTAPYLLWSAGPDGRYGSALEGVTTDAVPSLDNQGDNATNVARCDDVTNFR